MISTTADFHLFDGGEVGPHLLLADGSQVFGVDAAFAEAAFSFVPPSLIDRAVTFHQGEALIAGKISPQPALLRFGTRITEEGGADVPATWAAARSEQIC